MIAVQFEKKKMLNVLAALYEGKPIPPLSPVGYTAHDFLMIAGCCWCMAMRYGPQQYRREKCEHLHPETAEAVTNQFFDDLTKTVELFGDVAMRIQDGNYDKSFEGTVTITAHARDGKVEVYPVSGYK